MDIYEIWFNLREGVSDMAFAVAARGYLDHLEAEGHLASWRLTRRKLGLGPSFLPEFHLSLEFEGLARLDAAFVSVSTRADPVEGFHHAVNGKVKDTLFALYRDFPDAHRVTGQERF
jgi:hypothetical protein